MGGGWREMEITVLSQSEFREASSRPGVGGIGAVENEAEMVFSCPYQLVLAVVLLFGLFCSTFSILYLPSSYQKHSVTSNKRPTD